MGTLHARRKSALRGGHRGRSRRIVADENIVSGIFGHMRRHWRFFKPEGPQALYPSCFRPVKTIDPLAGSGARGQASDFFFVTTITAFIERGGDRWKADHPLPQSTFRWSNIRSSSVIIVFGEVRFEAG